MMASLGLEPVLLVEDDVYRLRRWADLVMVDWRGLPTRDRLQVFEAAIADAASGDQKVTVVVRLRPGLGVPSSEMRDEITRVMRDSQSFTAGWCVVIEGDGFFAATHRSLTATMHLLSGSKVKLKVFKTPAEAATWVVQLSPGHSAGDVALVIDRG